MQDAPKLEETFTRQSSPPEAAQAYADYFSGAFRKLYGNGPDGRLRWSSAPRNWQDPLQAVEYELDHPWQGSTQWKGADRETLAPKISQWLKEQGVVSLAHAAHGWNDCTGAVFDAKFTNGGDEPQIVRIGVAPTDVDFFKTRWCPLVIQPSLQSAFPAGKTGNDHQFFMEHTPRSEMLDWLKENENDEYPPSGFGRFLNENVLKDTPFEVTEYYDCTLLKDGTPVFAGWDPIRVRPENAAEYEERQHDPAYRQDIMRKLHQNYEKIGWPPALRAVVEKSPGVFVSKQDVLYNTPATNAPRPQPPVIGAP